jgi:hypothetical protein
VLVESVSWLPCGEEQFSLLGLSSIMVVSKPPIQSLVHVNTLRLLISLKRLADSIFLLYFIRGFTKSDGRMNINIRL